jgi:amino acid transporter
MLLALINIGSTTAFNALVSLVIASFYSSFLIAAGVMLHKRLTLPDAKILWGPFKLGRAGVPITVLSIAYTVLGIFFSFWPASPTVTPNTMNWSIAVFGGTLIFCLFFWMIYGRHVYKGPIIEVSLN